VCKQATESESNINCPIKLRIMNSLGTKIAGTVIVGVCWLAFAILFLTFFAGNFDFFQDLEVFIVSLIVAISIVAVIWIKWALG